MTKILYLKTSPRGDASYSNRVAAHAVDELRKTHAGATVEERDLALEQPGHIDQEFLSALGTPPRNAGRPGRRGSRMRIC
jgi:FMN-dependent NADH-azoreductase